MPRRQYTPQQKAYLKHHYARLSNAELARILGIDKPRKVLDLARRLGLKWRAENGAPQWCERRPISTSERFIWLY